MAGTRKRISELDKITSPSSDDLFITDTNAGTKAITYNNLTSGLKSECEEYADGKVGDLTNLTTTEKASIVGAVNELDNDKVDKETGKGLSTNDYTTAEKNKLSGIDNGAEVNQNAFSNVKVGSTTVAADSATDTLTLVAGSNVTITPDATNDKITIAAKDTTYGVATQSANGLMASTDKTKLNGIATGANKYTLPSASSSTLGGVKLSDSTTVTDSTGLALPVTEKNPNVSGSLANQISQLNTDCLKDSFIDVDTNTYTEAQIVDLIRNRKVNGSIIAIRIYDNQAKIFDYAGNYIGLLMSSKNTNEITLIFINHWYPNLMYVGRIFSNSENLSLQKGNVIFIIADKSNCAKLMGQLRIKLGNENNLITDLSYGFTNCSLITLPTPIYLGGSIKIHSLFNGAENLTTVPTLIFPSSTQEVSNVGWNSMFKNCYSLESIPVNYLSPINDTNHSVQ